MGKLIKPYEISVWDDIWESGAFVEKRLGIIGSDKMFSQSRALNPQLSKSANGVKKFSFQMYKRYIDTTTGEEVENPFVDWLISERKVKLKYKNKWYDFIIKGISENSSNYLYTYELEDAIVQELSKNGFGVTLDPELQNDMGTANKLAKRVLKETNWTVSDSSEAFVQKIEEALVYITIPARTTAHLIQDQTSLEHGVNQDDEIDTTFEFQTESTCLAFYSSCTNKPHRFQFIYSLDGYEKDVIEKDNNRVIKMTEKQHQYYIDIDDPETEYSVFKEAYGFYLPAGFNTTGGGGVATDTTDTTISTWYRGERYGYAQQSKYIPVLKKYVSIYEKDGETYYGYVQDNYTSPALTQNLISNPEFKSNSGWVGGRSDASGEKAEVEAVYGRFEVAVADKRDFIDSITDLSNGDFEKHVAKNFKDGGYSSLMKINFKSNDSLVLNSGPYDNRTIIGNMKKDEQWAVRYTCYNEFGKEVDLGDGKLSFNLQEFLYDGVSDCHSQYPDGIKTSISYSGKYIIFTVNETIYSEKEFKRGTKIKLSISPTLGNTGIYYFKELYLFKVCRDKQGNIIDPEEQADQLIDGVVDKTYCYFKPSRLDGINSEEELVLDQQLKQLKYDNYKPVYNVGAQKVRSVAVKESNYFNILQSIAETFEAWLELSITRNEQGAIINKQVAFKNYIGNNNYAGFKYGINLKDIQRTYESKNIVTKLIVKQNSNELGKNGFCTIARAGSNPTGENYIYDFQYYHNTGILNANTFINNLYAIDGAKGKDINEEHTELNLNGYYPRLKNINRKLESLNEELSGIEAELTKYQAELEVAKAGWEASNSGLEEINNDFYAANLVYPGNTDAKAITSASLSSENKEGVGYIQYIVPSWLDEGRVVIEQNGMTFTFKAKATDTLSSQRSITITAMPKLVLSDERETVQERKIKLIFPANSDEGEGSLTVSLTNINSNSNQKLLKEYSVFWGERQNYERKETSLQALVDGKLEQKRNLDDEITKLKGYKELLNKEFFIKYSRFIQEGTWISEEYVDDEKYFADSQSVLYNSCYPQVAYSVNVIAIDGIPEYEQFKFELGDKTYVEDPEFFGEKRKEEVVITETIEYLDDPSKNVIKVQNFKNQFQDLFQKITATVQQAQYSTGSYEKAVALAEAQAERKKEFLNDALSVASAKLEAAGQQSVVWGNDGITVKDVDSPCDSLRMIGGAILLSKQDQKTGEQKWTTGLTADGISANLITTGILNAGEIMIMDYDTPVFRWDSYGISAYDATWYDNTISGVNTHKFVRFDKYGIYGIDGGVDGSIWRPGDQEEIDQNATFALTWDGLKVTGENENIVAKIGRLDDYILRIYKKEGVGKTTDLMSFSNEGVLQVGQWTVNQNGFTNGGQQNNGPATYGLRRTAETKPEVFLNATPVERSIVDWGQKGNDNIVFKAGENFMVSENGTLYANSGYIGTLAIKEVAGKTGIGDVFSWSFDGDEGMKMWRGTNTDENLILSIDEEGLKMWTKGNAEANPVFSVNGDGLQVSGDITAGSTITGSTITGSTIKNLDGSFKVDPDGNITGATIKSSNGPFEVDSEGNITGANITGSEIIGSTIKNDQAGSIFSFDDKGGKIASWDLSQYQLTNENITFNTSWETEYADTDNFPILISGGCDPNVYKEDYLIEGTVTTVLQAISFSKTWSLPVNKSKLRSIAVEFIEVKLNDQILEKYTPTIENFVVYEDTFYIQFIISSQNISYKDRVSVNFALQYHKAAETLKDRAFQVSAGGQVSGTALVLKKGKNSIVLDAEKLQKLLALI